MTITLGIDTGGTYTDAVLIEQPSGKVLASAKALTTHHDLAIGIGEAVAAVLGTGVAVPSDIGLAALSTTLATNAIVEGRGSPVCLLLIGYDPALIAQYGFDRELAAQDVVYVRGGHDGSGDEIEPLDEAALREAVLARLGRVEAFAVSGYFGVRNPSHELRARELIDKLAASCGAALPPVTCGHELSMRLNAVRRAATAALNARLIPLLRELITTVRGSLDAHGVTAPLMVVRGDGSLVRAAWALRRPIETILSGPAASVLGAWHLSRCSDGWVVDVGGTTTDIAMLRSGRPRLNPEGAQVGGWRTMVQAVDVHTVGQGGDSMVRLDADRHILIGPRRVMPLCLLASMYPEIKAELRQQAVRPHHSDGQFVMALRPAPAGLSEEDRLLLQALAAGPCALRTLVERARYGLLVVRRIEALEVRWLAARAAFTPTDALHVLGRFTRWDDQASLLGAELLAAPLGLSPLEFCEQVVASVSQRVAAELVSKALADEGLPHGAAGEEGAAALLARALEAAPGSALGVSLTLRHPLVAIGAPAEAYLPRTASLLHTQVAVPDFSEVANAVGAAVGSVIQQMRVELRPLDSSGLYRLHLPDGVRDFPSLEEGVAYARQVLPARLEALALEAGTDQVEVSMARADHFAPVAAGWGEELYLGTELTFTAVGRPSPAALSTDVHLSR